MAADGARTWILTGSPENHSATAAHGYAVSELYDERTPIEHCKLACQGPLRTVCDADAALLMDRLYAACGVAPS